MQNDHLENPPEHAGSAPQAEIREQPAGVLGMFTVVIAIAIALPAIVFVALGVEMGRRGILYAGILLFIGLLIFCSVALWKIIASRPTHFRDSEIR
jgi:hypothetical protein